MKRCFAALILALPLAVQATGYHYAPPPVIPKPVVVPRPVTSVVPVQQSASSTASAASGSKASAFSKFVTRWVPWLVVGSYFAGAIWVHASCIAREDEAKVPDDKRECYKHRGDGSQPAPKPAQAPKAAAVAVPRVALKPAPAPAPKPAKATWSSCVRERPGCYQTSAGKPYRFVRDDGTVHIGSY